MQLSIGEFLARDATHALTLKPNNSRPLTARPGKSLAPRSDVTTMPMSMGQNWPLNRLQSTVGKMMARIQKELFGKYWTEIAPLERVHGWCLVEGLPSDGHVHAALIVPVEHRDAFRKMFPPSPGGPAPLWNAWAKGGTACLDEIYNANGWGRYISKNVSADSPNWFPID